MDNLITIKTEIENAFEHKQILGMISLDITKAYDSVWRHRILALLSKILTNGNMFMYITNYLKERQFQVKVSHTLSKTFYQENGIPQGSSLAVTLFLLAINDIVETIKVPVKANLFADDFNIFCRSKNLKTVQELLQISANSLSDWSKKTGFSFSNLKSKSIIFTKQKKIKDLNIILDNLVIPHHNKIKILGITFDSKLNWIPHLKNIRDSLSQKLNIIKIIAHTSWGGDSASLLMIYKALIRSKTDYGSILLKNAKTNHLNMVQTKLNTAIRLSIGGFKSSPIESIRNIANEIPPNLRREKLLLLYCARTKRNINNPAIKVINAHIQQAEKENIKINNILERKPYIFPPWNTTFNVNLTLTQFKKENTMPSIYKNMLNNILQEHPNSVHIYTDASKTNDGVGLAMIINNQTIAYKLPPQASIFTAEAMAIYKAVKYFHTEYSNHQTKCIILSDSLSNLIAITNTRNQTDITKLIQEETFLAENKNIYIQFVWIPGHIGIPGNEMADQEAHNAITSKLTATIKSITFADAKNEIKLHTNNKWHSYWRKLNTKLNKIKNNINLWINLELSRKEETIINRLRIGHTHLTHSYLMTKDDPPLCDACNVLLTVNHVITECQKYNMYRNQYHISEQICQALGPNPQDCSDYFLVRVGLATAPLSVRRYCRSRYNYSQNKFPCRPPRRPNNNSPVPLPER
ncbi:uncharacterized protein LOC132952480 [Metopolophium dirhodum]|uniref:uncharacterized protein LOC132952480 n=1 Tax=Metopolophium dirhodum TaxID=44670 RepID=UPI0029907F7B|nr:uncharacterized protein LOC132952480 [Metopolophium dirhodum]